MKPVCWDSEPEVGLGEVWAVLGGAPADLLEARFWGVIRRIANNRARSESLCTIGSNMEAYDQYVKARSLPTGGLSVCHLSEHYEDFWFKKSSE